MDMQRVQDFVAELAVKRAGNSAILLTYLGDKLGIWKALAGAGPVSSEELAERTGLSERYLREWLAAQAVAEHVHYDPASGRFELPAEHAAVLADENSLAYQGGGTEIAAALWLSVDRVAEAFRTGHGIGWDEHDERLSHGVAKFFGPLYRMALVDQWLPALDGVVDKLRSGIRVLDVGCGHGISTILMAQEFPESRFVGIDVHEESVEAAREAARQAGVADRVTFLVGDANDRGLDRYELICFFDALHDMGDPLGAAKNARASLTEDGTVLLVEPYAPARLEESIGNPIALAYYASSTTLCLPNSLSQPVGLGLGAQAGPEPINKLMAEAGFSQCRQALATEINLILEVRP